LDKSVARGPELRDYLVGVPDEWARAIATRVALRVLPLAFSGAGALDLRPFFVAWAALFYEQHLQLLAAVASATQSKNSNDVSSSGISAAAAIASSADAARGNASRAAAYAARAAGKASRGAEKIIWSSVNADIRWLELRTDQALIHQPLWLVDVRGDKRYLANFPIWVRKSFDKFAKGELGASGAWQLWIGWYRAILPNGTGEKPKSFFGEKSDVRLASSEPKYWEQDLERVMAGIGHDADVDDELGSNSPAWIELSSVNPTPAYESHTFQTTFQDQPPIESVEPQSDEPTADDQLGRRPFAQALVERMDKIYQKGGHDGFAAHIYAPWGAGKTSVLMMMRDLMVTRDRKSADGEMAPHWVVVGFNAWEQERRNPPWWPLVEAVKGDCLTRLSGSSGGLSFLLKFLKSWWLEGYRVDLQPLLLQARWLSWKVRTDALPYVVLAVVFAASLWVLWYTGTAGTSYEWVLKIFTAAVAAFASFFGASRIAVFGSANNAKFYDDISQDPLKRITRLFKVIVKTTNKPICIFIDDLDRCRSDYVVDLLEGIQTSFRHKNVAYVIAADRGWIKASFEARYGTFAGTVGSLGQPLGYLFLEKVFQVSTPVPGMGNKARLAYWNNLLRGASSRRSEPKLNDASESGLRSLYADPTELFDDTVAAKRANLREKHGQNLTREQAETILQESDTAEDLAAVVLELNTSRAVEREAEHLLARFTDVLPDNPRVMKRMINAFAMRQTIGLLEGNAVPTEVLARWTILEQRFPALADLLVDHPEWVQILETKIDNINSEELPELLRPFLNTSIVQNVIGSADENRLNAENLRAITRGSIT
jgi:KAP family P-loop domain